MQRKKFTPILAGCLCTLLLCGCTETNEPPITSVADETNAVFSMAGFRRTELYYASDEGFLVPVTKQIPWEEGIGKAALMQLVANEENRAAASQRGLLPVIPDGTTFTLRIDGQKHATVDVIGMQAAQDAQQEQNIVSAIVNTLTVFPTIDSVSILFDGKAPDALPHSATALSDLSYQPLNAEQAETPVMTGEQYPLTLYFPNAAASLNIPVTRMIAQPADAETAVKELLRGPQNDALPQFFPQDTTLLSMENENGYITLHLSEAFLSAFETDGIVPALYDAIYLTLSDLEPVSALTLQSGSVQFPSVELPHTPPLSVNEFSQN